MDLSYKTPEELQAVLGERLRAMRLGRNLAQRELAGKAGLSLRALINLEAGGGSTVESLVRVLKALDATGAIELLAPQPQVSPLQMLKQGPQVRRAGRSRASKRGKA